MDGLGCKDTKMAEITGQMNSEQRLAVRKIYNEKCSSGQWKSGYKKNLDKWLERELKGSKEKLFRYCYKSLGEIDGFIIRQAFNGMGYDTALVCEILCTRTNQQLRDMAAEFNKVSKKTLKERCREETKKTMSSNNFQTLCLKILEAKRPENKKPVQQQIVNDAEELNRFLTQEKKKDAKAKFIEIFTERSWAHLAELSSRFADISKKYTLVASIKKAFGDGSDTSTALQIIAKFVSEPYDYWAQKLRASMKGMGTKDDDLIRIVATRCEIDMDNIKRVFGQRYGDGKTLRDWIRGDTSGSYAKLLCYLCGYEV